MVIFASSIAGGDMPGKVDHDFLRAITRAGLAVVTVYPGEVEAVEPETGRTFTLKPGDSIPQRGIGQAGEVAVSGFEDARDFLLKRAQSLGLILADLEECAGLTNGHANKISNGMRRANWDTVTMIAQSLGYEVVLRHRGLPPITLSIVAGAAPASARRRSRRATIEAA